MKISLVHCYSDHNRGDTGIISSIVDLIKEAEPSCVITGISTFGQDDIRFTEDHNHTRKTIEHMYPSFFPEPGQQTANRTSSFSERLLKPLRFTSSLIKNLTVLTFGSEQIAKLVYNESEFRSFKSLIDSDRVISKGGSFLYSFKGMRGNLFFIRMIFPLYLAKRFSVQTYIYSQSIGPFQNRTASFLFNLIMPKIDGIYLRESSCLKYIKEKTPNIHIISDSAFALKYDKQQLSFTLVDGPKIAITARPHKFEASDKQDNYINGLTELIKTARQDGYVVYLIAQVTGPTAGEDDRNALIQLKSSFLNDPNVIYISDDFCPRELKLIYSQMCLVVGTRLHSTIFSLGAFTPSINIAYHGTKSEGIMGRLGLQDYVIHIEAINNKNITELFKKAITNRVKIIDQLKNNLPELKTELLSAMKEILSTSPSRDTTPIRKNN